MTTIHKELSDKLLELLPTKSDEAMNVHQLKQLMTWRLAILSIPTIRASIKELRLSWVPILWNSRWSYISYEQDAILIQQETIDRMKAWFCAWMNRIKWWYDKALESDKIIT